MSNILNAPAPAPAPAPAAASKISSYSILSVPFYDTKQQQYRKILCVNSGSGPVAGPLAARVKLVHPPRLSGFHNNNHNNHNTHNTHNTHNNHNNKCIHAITASLSACCAFMTPDDLPELFAFLATNGYTVDLGLTKLAAKHPSITPNSNSNSLVCIISYPHFMPAFHTLADPASSN